MNSRNKMLKRVIYVVFAVAAGAGFLLGSSSARGAQPDVETFCERSGKIAFVANRNQADVRIHFVSIAEDARVSFKTNSNEADSPGEWRVVSRYASPDVKAYIEPYAGKGIVNVRVVETGTGCP